MGEKTFPPWTKTGCRDCGVEFQVTRTQTRTIQGKIICGECQTYDLGYRDGLRHVKKKCQELLEYIDNLEKSVL